MINTAAIPEFLNLLLTFFCVQIGRCLFLSYFVLGAVLLLRKTLFKKAVFLKSLVWVMALWLPFAGKIRAFYENEVIVKLSFWWQIWCIKFPLIPLLYFLVAFLFFAFIMGKNIRLKALVKKMPATLKEGEKIHISDLKVTPFAVGAFRPVIAVPEVMLSAFSPDELRLVVRHEKNHIRLGHLLFYFAWDVLRALLWPNPLFGFCMKEIKEDFEDVCDRVTIQECGGNSYAYGNLLLKSMKILQADSGGFSVTFAGEDGYETVKRRFLSIADFHSYKKRVLTGMYLLAAVALLGGYGLLHAISYPSYTENEGISILNENNEYVFFDSKELFSAIRIDEENVYVNREALNAVFRERGIVLKDFFIVFGGYTKGMGFGGGGNAVYVTEENGEKDLVMPYRDNDREMLTVLFKYL